MKRIILIVIGVIVGVPLAVSAFFIARQAWAAARADQKWRASQVQPLREIGSTSTLEILPLYEEAGDQTRFQTGHGLSYLVKTDSATILMDVGDNPNESGPSPLSANMQALGVTWDQIDAVVISHFHPDHAGGFNAWQAGKVSLGSGSFDLAGKSAYVPVRLDFPGLTPVVSADPTVLYPGIATTGSIEYGEIFPVSLFKASGAEQALAVNVTGKGIVLVVGCGHPGLERILARAEAVFKQPIAGVVGGLHYEGLSPEEVQAKIALLQSLNPSLVALSPHDSSADTLAAFKAAFSSTYQDIQVGVPLTLR